MLPPAKSLSANAMHDFSAHFKAWLAVEYVNEQEHIDAMIEYRDKKFPDGNFPAIYCDLENKVGKKRAFWLQEDVRDGYPLMEVKWIWEDEMEILQAMLADYVYQAPPKNSYMPRYIHKSIPIEKKKERKEKIKKSDQPEIDESELSD